MAETIQSLSQRFLESSKNTISPYGAGLPQSSQTSSDVLKQGLKNTVMGQSNPVSEYVTEKSNTAMVDFIVNKIHGVFGDYGLVKISLYIIIVSIGFFSFFKTLPGEKVIHLRK